MPRGSKTCPKCNRTCGPRSFECPGCGENFNVNGKKKTPKVKIARKRKPKAVRVVDWRVLQPGTRFKVTSGSGPYYTTADSRLYIAEKGYFTVKEIKEDGLIATDDSGMWNFIYMGETKISPNIPNLTREAHRIWVKQ